ncbi:hypothetical protein ACLOJK_003889 [Asimina triloba]
MPTLSTSTKQVVTAQGRKVLRAVGIAGDVSGTVAGGADDGEADASIIVGGWRADGHVAAGGRQSTTAGLGVHRR